MLKKPTRFPYIRIDGIPPPERPCPSCGGAIDEYIREYRISRSGLLLPAFLFGGLAWALLFEDRINGTLANFNIGAGILIIGLWWGLTSLLAERMYIYTFDRCMNCGKKTNSGHQLTKKPE